MNPDAVQRPNMRLKLAAPGLGRNCVCAPPTGDGSLSRCGTGGGRRRTL